MRRARPSLVEFLDARLGPGSPALWAGRMFSRSFTAPTFRGFWYYWNPLYGYILLYVCYVPLRHIVPSTIAFIVTFALSGFVLHDLFAWLVLPVRAGSLLFPVVTIALILVALFTLVTERIQLSLRALSPAFRAVCHAGVILTAFAMAMGAAMLTVRAG
jgi:hypothetical protein